MGTERIFCTVKGGFTRVYLAGDGGIEHLALASPCIDCPVRSMKSAEAAVEALSATYLMDMNSTGSFNVTVAPHEDNPEVPEEVKVGDLIVLSCSYGFTS